MESDFRTGFRNTVSHVKVKKDESPLIIETVVEPKKIEVPKVELPEKIIEEKEVVKTEIIVEESKEVVQVTEQEEFESLDLNSEELMEIKKLALKDILSEDLAISELVSGASSKTFTFAYDTNVQKRNASSGTNAPVTVVAIGLGTAQYVRATGTITRSTSNTVSLAGALERNYSNM